MDVQQGFMVGPGAGHLALSMLLLLTLYPGKVYNFNCAWGPEHPVNHLQPHANEDLHAVEPIVQLTWAMPQGTWRRVGRSLAVQGKTPHPAWEAAQGGSCGAGAECQVRASEAVGNGGPGVSSARASAADARAGLGTVSTHAPALWCETRSLAKCTCCFYFQANSQAISFTTT